MFISKSMLTSTSFSYSWNVVGLNNVCYFSIFINNIIFNKSNSGVCLCGQCLEDSFSHCPFLVELVYINSVSLCVCDGGFEGWGKGEAGEATSEKSNRVCNRPLPPPPPHHTRPDPIGLNARPRHRQTGCIMHRVHTSYI